jgi:arginine decarboxylase
MVKKQDKMMTTTIDNIAILSNPISYVPKIMFLTKGKGLHKDYLTSFELALRDAEIADLNLVSVSSIKPSNCKIVSRQEGRKHLMSG